MLNVKFLYVFYLQYYYYTHKARNFAVLFTALLLELEQSLTHGRSLKNISE